MYRVMYMMPALLIACLGSSCASIAGGGHEQTVSINTAMKSVKINGAICELKNDQGVWYVTTPGSVTVHRSSTDLHISCDKTGYNNGVSVVKSTIKGAAAGNIMLGPIVGSVGMLVDNASGAAYDYPSLTTVDMKNKTVASASPVKATNKTLASIDLEKNTIQK